MVFNRFTVLGYNDEKRKWEARCECGNIRFFETNVLRLKTTKSCGCYRKQRLQTHGHFVNGQKKSKEWVAWMAMKQRCYYEPNNHWKDYGGRGIKVCDEWLNDYAKFREDMGECPPGHSLDRILVNESYYKSNCKWSSKIQQANNTRRCVYVSYRDRTQTVSQWCRELRVISAATALNRIRYENMDPVAAITTPPKPGNNQKQGRIYNRKTPI